LSTPQAQAPGAARRRFEATDLVSLLIVGVSAGLLWLKPATVYRCAPQAPGLARCEISERLLGLVPLRSRAFEGIARVTFGEHTQQSTSLDSQGRTRTTSTDVEELALLDAQARVLWRRSESHLLGASLADLAGELELLVSGESAEPFARWHQPWPVLLITSLFLLLGASHLATRLGLVLIQAGWLPAGAHAIVYWGPTLALLLLLGAAWGVAWVGADPPAWLA
jgi:hypothetical protein